MSTSAEADVNPVHTFLTELATKLNTQGNRCTQDPLFVVFQKKQVFGVTDEYTENSVWVDVDSDYAEATPEKVKVIERYTRMYGGLYPRQWRRIGYKEVDEFVTAMFSEEAALLFVSKYHYNYRKPFVYAASLHRNPEMIQIRKMLMAESTPSTPAQ